MSTNSRGGRTGDDDWRGRSRGHPFSIPHSRRRKVPVSRRPHPGASPTYRIDSLHPDRLVCDACATVIGAVTLLEGLIASGDDAEDRLSRQPVGDHAEQHQTTGSRSSFRGRVMRESDRVQLLAGPYTPALERGDRSTCLYRDAEVVITSWTAAPISWPRCYRPGSGGGGSGLLVTYALGELGPR